LVVAEEVGEWKMKLSLVEVEAEAVEWKMKLSLAEAEEVVLMLFAETHLLSEFRWP
jgi:hypothetical protein